MKCPRKSGTRRVVECPQEPYIAAVAHDVRGIKSALGINGENVTSENSLFARLGRIEITLASTKAAEAAVDALPRKIRNWVAVFAAMAGLVGGGGYVVKATGAQSAKTDRVVAALAVAVGMPGVTNELVRAE